MSRKKIKIFSSLALVLFLVLSFLLSNNSSSYISPFTKPKPSPQDDHSSQGEVESASVSVDFAPKSQGEINDNSGSETTPEGAQTYKVVKVVDGDTVDVDIDGSTTRLRIIGIDTPETVDPRKPVQCFGREASNKAKEILSGQFVTLAAEQSQGNTDKYGRLLRYIALLDGTDYGLYMISEGYAHEYTYHLPYEKQAEYKQAEVDARNNNKGLWSPDTCSGNK